MQDLNDAVQFHPDQPYAFVGRGEFLLDQGDAVGALKDFEIALRLNPVEAAAYVGRATVNAAVGDPGDTTVTPPLLDFLRTRLG